MSRNMHGDRPGSLAFVVAVIGGVLAAPVSADVVPIDVGAFGPGATIETFEGIVGVEIPADPFFTIFGDLPVPFDFGNGVVLTGSNVPPDGNASIADFSVDPGSGVGWGLSLQGGSIEEDTVIPSGTSFLTHGNIGPSGELVPLELTFDAPVSRVGAFLEASILDGVLDGFLSLEAFDGLGNSLGLVTGFADGAGRLVDDPSIDLGPLDTWLGLETADSQPLIKRVEIIGDFMVMDDLHFEVVPEPATLTLLAISSLLCRRRR